MSEILIKTKGSRGFWRAGIFFTPAGVPVNPSTLTADQRTAIENEPELELVDPMPSIAAPPSDPPAADQGSTPADADDTQPSDTTLLAEGGSSDQAFVDDALDIPGEELATAEEVTDPLPDALQQAAVAITAPVAEDNQNAGKKAVTKSVKKAGKAGNKPAVKITAAKGGK